MDDTALYTGLTSVSFSKIKNSKDDRKKELSKKRAVLLPAGELLKAEFEKEIKRVSQIDYVQLDQLSNEFEVKAELMAQKRTIELLKRIQQRITNTLRDNKDE